MNTLARLLLSLVLWISTAHGAELNTLDIAQSRIVFAYKQMNVPMEGGFKRFGGQLVFDPAKPTLARTALTIDLASIDTGSAEGDAEVAGKLWFNTRQFPVARFESTSVKALGNNRFLVTGKMSIKGRTRVVSTPASFSQQGANGVFEGAFVIKRADYGIGEGLWADFDAVANEVQIRYRLVASAAATKSSRNAAGTKQ